MNSASLIREAPNLSLRRWKWMDARIPAQAQLLTSRRAYELLDNSFFYHPCLYKYWGRQDSEVIWSTRLKRIWSADLHPRSKVFLWRIITLALFTESKAKQLKKSTAVYHFCPGFQETPNHIFFDCAFATDCWRKITSLFANRAIRGSFQNAANYIDILDMCLGVSSMKSIMLATLYDMSWHL